MMVSQDKERYVNDAVLIRQHVQDYLDHSVETETTFTIRVRELYEATVPPHARTIQFSDNPDPIIRLEADRNKVFGFLANTLRRRHPVEISPFVIKALPERRGFALQSALGARQSLIVIPMPKVGGAGRDAEALSRLIEEFSDVTRSYGKLLDDGVVDERDAAKAPDAIQQIDELVAVALSLREHIVRSALSPVDDELVEKLA